MTPVNTCRESTQRVAQVDHRVDAAAEKVRRLHPAIPQKSNPIGMGIERNYHWDPLRKASIHTGLRDLAGPTLWAYRLHNDPSEFMQSRKLIPSLRPRHVWCSTNLSANLLTSYMCIKRISEPNLSRDIN